MGNRHVIFIHGIGEQTPGYSTALWKLLQDGKIPGDVEHHEMFYYDIFQTANAKTELAKLPSQYGLNSLIEKLIADSVLAGKVESELQDVLVNTVAHVLHFCLNQDVRNAIIQRFREYPHSTLTSRFSVTAWGRLSAISAATRYSWTRRSDSTTVSVSRICTVWRHRWR